MSKVLVDTNVIIDLLARREPFHEDSAQLFSLADSNSISLIVSTLSLVNAHYIMNDIMKIKEARSIIGKFKVLVTSQALSDKIVELALSDPGFKDFEDGLQYYSALESDCSIIVTRNLKDFKKSSIPVLSPRAFISKFKSEM